MSDESVILQNLMVAAERTREFSSTIVPAPEKTCSRLARILVRKNLKAGNIGMPCIPAFKENGDSVWLPYLSSKFAEQTIQRLQSKETK
jgi:hypothetical protein